MSSTHHGDNNHNSGPYSGSKSGLNISGGISNSGSMPMSFHSDSRRNSLQKTGTVAESGAVEPAHEKDPKMFLLSKLVVAADTKKQAASTGINAFSNQFAAGGGFLNILDRVFASYNGTIETFAMNRFPIDMALELVAQAVVRQKFDMKMPRLHQQQQIVILDSFDERLNNLPRNCIKISQVDAQKHVVIALPFPEADEIVRMLAKVVFYGGGISSYPGAALFALLMSVSVHPQELLQYPGLLDNILFLEFLESVDGIKVQNGLVTLKKSGDSGVQLSQLSQLSQFSQFGQFSAFSQSRPGPLVSPTQRDKMWYQLCNDTSNFAAAVGLVSNGKVRQGITVLDDITSELTEKQQFEPMVSDYVWLPLLESLDYGKSVCLKCQVEFDEGPLFSSDFWNAGAYAGNQRESKIMTFCLKFDNNENLVDFLQRVWSDCLQLKRAADIADFPESGDLTGRASAELCDLINASLKGNASWEQKHNKVVSVNVLQLCARQRMHIPAFLDAMETHSRKMELENEHKVDYQYVVSQVPLQLYQSKQGWTEFENELEKLVGSDEARKCQIQISDKMKGEDGEDVVDITVRFGANVIKKLAQNEEHKKLFDTKFNAVFSRSIRNFKASRMSYFGIFGFGGK